MEKSKNGVLSGLLSLSLAEVRHLAIPRDGWEAFATPLLELYDGGRSVLRIQGFDPSVIRRTLHTYQAMAPAEAAARARVRVAQAELATVVGTRGVYASTVWRAMLQIYDRSLSAGHSDLRFMHGIAGFAAFMKTGPRKKATAAGTV